MSPDKNQSQTKTTSRSKATIKRPGVMNRLETRYSEHLESRREAGEIVRWDYEPEKFRLAKATFYTPDFRVVTKEHFIELHEVKGFWRGPGGQNGRTKLKVASEMHPYRFIAVQWKDKAWVYEYFDG